MTQYTVYTDDTDAPYGTIVCDIEHDAPIPDGYEVFRDERGDEVMVKTDSTVIVASARSMPAVVLTDEHKQQVFIEDNDVSDPTFAQPWSRRAARERNKEGGWYFEETSCSADQVDELLDESDVVS